MRVRRFVSLLLLPLLAATGCSTSKTTGNGGTDPQSGWHMGMLNPFAKPKTQAAAPNPATQPPPATVPATSPAPSPSFGTSPKPSLMWRIMHPFAKSDAPAVKSGVELAVVPSNSTPSLAETRQIGLTIQVINHTRNLVSLNFPTTQRIEIIARTPEGRILSTWSEDRSFAQEFTVVTINPGERIEYSESVPTRDMTTGKSYPVTVSIAGQDGLSTTVLITPRP